VNDGLATQAIVQNGNEGAVLSTTNGYLGSCTFNGDGYNCIAVVVNHPSHHTVEGIQADGEVIAVCQNATGDVLCVSALFRVHGSQSPSWKFFHEFVPYIDSDSESVSVALNDWSLAAMVPTSSSYFFYEGSTVVPACTPCKWVVFSHMINMDPNDFAFLVKMVQSGSSTVKPLGDRDVFFNDSQNASGGAMPRDNKVYIRCRSSGKKKAPTGAVQKVDLKSSESAKKIADAEEARNPTTFLGRLQRHASSYADKNGAIALVGIVLCILAGLLGIYFAFFRDDGSVYWLPKKAMSFGTWVRGFFVRKNAQAIPPAV
jgi:carbonic anhydrase